MVFKDRLIFDADTLKSKIRNIEKVKDSHIYQPVFHAICNLIENDKSEKTKTALKYILTNYVQFHPFDSSVTRYSSVTAYVADLTEMPKSVMKALLQRESFVMENKEKIDSDLENKVVKLLNSSEIIK